jgi:xanthine dehydrogenase accessory factor
MSSIYARMADLVAEGRRFAVATVVRTLGSTPQVVGAKLIITDDEGERPVGTLGGGCVEADAVLTGRDVIKSGERSLRAYRLSEELAWNTGLVCGGTMWILVETDAAALGSDALQRAREAASAAAGGEPLAVVTCLRRDGLRSEFAGRMLVRVDGAIEGTLRDVVADHRAADMAVEQMRHGTARLATLSDTLDLLIEPVTGQPELVIAGGGHVARAIARQAALLDFAVTVLEDRPEFADPSRFDGARVVSGDVPATIPTLEYGWQAYLVIATRGHKLDADCVAAAVRTPVRYIGVLGSRRKTIMIEEMLRERGVADERIAVIHAPVGLDLGGRTPAEIALSVMAEITKERYAGTGASLSTLGPESSRARSREHSSSRN